MNKKRYDRINEYAASNQSVTIGRFVFKQGDSVMAFNGIEWQKTGDIGDNSQFYQEAKIVRLYFHNNVGYKGGDWCADIQWKHNGEMSMGYFVSQLKQVK
jgi:hypothetical protein